MALKMARPIRLKAGGSFHLKQRVPADIASKMRGELIALPIGDIQVKLKVGEFVQASLRTSDRAQAKERHVIADAALKLLWDARRKGTDATVFHVEPRVSRIPMSVPSELDGGHSISVAKLVERFFIAKEGRLKPGTLKRYKASFETLAACTQEKPLSSITSDDIYAWGEHRRDEDNVSPTTFNKTDLAAASSLFRWAMSREAGRLLIRNPVDRKDVRLDEKGMLGRTREKAFRAQEIQVILNAALHIKIDPRNPKMSFARRWCPWLAAYSGARITELTSLLGSDVRMEGNIPVMDFRETKTDLPRTVPLHAHIIEMGFLDFAKEQGSGPLFYDERRRKPGSKNNLAENCSQKLATWVRVTANLDKALMPNHAWRHTWKTRAIEVGIEPSLRDAITGHREASVGRSYEHKSVQLLDRAMKMFPRYEIDEEKHQLHVTASGA